MLALKDLSDPDLEKREAAMKSIAAAARGELTPEDIRTIIAEASKALPKARFEFQSYEVSLLQAVAPHLRNEHITALVEQLPKLSERGRPAAIAALAGIGTEEGAAAFVHVLQHYGWPAESYPAMTMRLTEEPRFANVVLPSFVDTTIRGLPSEVRWMVLLSYAEAGSLPQPIAESARPGAVEGAQLLLEALQPLQKPSGIAWRFEEAYDDSRGKLGLVLDLLGYLGRDERLLRVLRAAEALADPRLRFFAMSSLLRLGEAVSKPAITAVASDAETRNMLLARLISAKKQDLFPKSQLVQAKLAESNMVSWLTFPTELARAPDEIELMKTVERNAGEDGGVFVYYVFRFKTYAPHWAADKGWVAGISGPFRKADFPTTEAWGDTFSTFTSWETFTPDEHLASVEDLMTRWREQHGE